MAWTDRDPPPYLFFIGAALVAGCGVGLLALPAMFDAFLILGISLGAGFMIFTATGTSRWR